MSLMPQENSRVLNSKTGFLEFLGKFKGQGVQISYPITASKELCHLGQAILPVWPQFLFFLENKGLD